MSRNRRHPKPKDSTWHIEQLDARSGIWFVLKGGGMSSRYRRFETAWASFVMMRKQWPLITMRLRNLKTGDIIMGDILR